VQGSKAKIQKHFKGYIASPYKGNYGVTTQANPLMQDNSMMWLWKEKDPPTTCLLMIQSRNKQAALYRMS
jgi:nitric oxide reductase activation protein